MSVSNDDHLAEAVRGLDRRTFLRGTASAVAVGGIAVAGGLLGTSQAWARPAALPPIGAEIPCSMLAINTPLTIRTSSVTVDFRGGIKFRVDVNPDDPQNSVRLRIIGHKVTAELPDARGRTRQGGSITIEQNDVDVDPKSLLTQTSQSPNRYDNTVVLDFTMTIDDPSQREREPLVLVTKNQQILRATLNRFPPAGDLYQQQNPVELVLPDDPDTVVAVIEHFPVKIGGL
jgi:hypothetical protein